MNNVGFVFLMMLLNAASGAVIHAKQDTNTTKSDGVLDLKLIGTADGVMYFYDDSTLKTWFEANAYCESFELQLAVINTESQEKLLMAAEVLSEYIYWTAGRDADAIRQFTWQREEIPAVPEFLQKHFYSNVMRYATCLALWKSPGYFNLSPTACSNSLRTLCST